MEDFINSIMDSRLRVELIRLWKLFPNLPIPITDGNLIAWPDLQCDLCLEWDRSGFLYYVDDEFSRYHFHERMEQFK